MPDNELPRTVDDRRPPLCSSETPPSTTGPETAASGEELPRLDLRGYELLERLGGGGMGDVYRAGDPALGRDLAVKVMKAEWEGSASAERRFLREARVTGSLQHPGIVPIHNLGRLADGRLHYTMRLVRGRTFADILKEDAGKPERLPSLLSIFEKICQAVAYAHSKRVIHRDLKPSNVMVGRFGEVQVMDWGLAKVMTAEDEPEEAAENKSLPILSEESETSPELTRMGQGMGTPAYMPPEQALGEWASVDERADVFALGAILCEILTGRPPYSGGREVLQRAQRGELTEAWARLEGCGADAALLELCRACLAAERTARPRDADQVAQRVAAYQTEVQERLRRAELERTAAQVKAREERKKRRWMLAAMLLLLTGAGISIWLMLWAKKAESIAKNAENTAQNRLGQIEKSNEVLTSIFRDLDPQAEEKGGPSLRQQLSQHLERAATQMDEEAVGDPQAVAGLQTTLGASLNNLGQSKLAIELLSKAVKTREAKLGPDHPDTVRSRGHLGTAYWSAGRTEEAITLNELNLKISEEKLGADHDETIAARNNLALVYTDEGRTDDAIRLYEQNLHQLEAKRGPRHRDTLTTRSNLGDAYYFTGRVAHAIRLKEQTLKDEETMLGSDHLNTAYTRSGLASAYWSAGRIADSIRLYEQNLKLCKAKLAPDHPLTLTTVRYLTRSYRSAGRSPEETIPLLEQLTKQYEAKLGPDHPDTLGAMASLATAFRDAGRVKEAIPLFETVLKRGRQRRGGYPPGLGWVPVAMAEGYEGSGQIAKAEAIYREALEHAQRQFGPDDLRTAGELALLSLNLLRQKKYADAEPLLRQCLTIRAKHQPDGWTTFNSRSSLGEALLGQRKYAEAEPLLVQGYQGLQQRQDNIKADIRQLRLSEALERLVRLYEATKQTEKAADYRKKWDEARKKSGEANAGILQKEQTLKELEARLGADEAETLSVRHGLANEYWSAGRIADSIRLHEQNLKLCKAKLGPDHPLTLRCVTSLTHSYRYAGRNAETIPLLEQNIKQCEAKLGADHPDTLAAMASLGVSYRDAGRFKEAFSLLETVLQRGRQRSGGCPGSIAWVPVAMADGYEWAGCTLLNQKKYTDAEPLLRQCLTIRAKEQPDDWTIFHTRSLLGETLVGQTKYAEAEPLLLQGYQGMKQRQDKIPSVSRQVRLSEALECLVHLYEATGQKDKAADWQKQLDEARASEKKSQSNNQVSKP